MAPIDSAVLNPIVPGHMSKAPGHDPIRIRGARHNNLKGFDLDLPTHRLVVVTGLSGSGKSSLAFDTLYAEGQRRYIETFSPYARQFFDRMDKPRVDAIEGIPPAIALEQRNSVRTTRSTVGTMTEICDHMKVLWPHLARLHCRACGKPVIKEAPRDVWERVMRTTSSAAPAATPPEALITFTVPLSAKLTVAEQIALVTRQGFQRIWLDGEVIRLDESEARLSQLQPPALHVVQDRIKLVPASRTRFVEACEQAYHFGHGKLTLLLPGAAASDGITRWNEPLAFSRHLHCAECDIVYATPTPALFSFNHPLGACPACKGFGRIIGIDYNLAIPDRSKTLAEGAVKPWQTGTGAESQADLVRSARKEKVPLDVPFRDLSPDHQRWVIEGAPDYGKDNEWPNAWYGIKGYFRYLESKAYKMHVRVLLSRYRAYTTCPTCSGKRFQPDALLWRIPRSTPAKNSPSEASDSATLSLPDFYATSVRDALRFVEHFAQDRPHAANDPFALALEEVRARLQFLDAVGVGYLTLDRPTRTLSGGETQRVNLTTCLGTRLVNTLFVLDEPSVGLHPRDTDRLVKILHRLRDLGNTVVVVEHEAAVMQAADEIIDLGPGHGDAGGHLVCQGPLPSILQHPTSLTAAYLSGRRQIEVPPRRPVTPPGTGTGPSRTPSRLRKAAISTPGIPLPADAASLRLADVSVPYHTGIGGPAEVPSPGTPHLLLRGVTRNNLQEINVDIPLGRLVCLTGVSGSGKTTLVSELLRLLEGCVAASSGSAQLGVREAERESQDDDAETETATEPVSRGRLEGAEHLGAVLLVDQSPIGRTPRSNPAVYTGAFEHIRDLFAQTDSAEQRGLNASAFSFNSAQGQCEQCRGAGFEKVEMQFLSDVFIRCPSCEGRRYRPHILEITLSPSPDAPPLNGPSFPAGVPPSTGELSIAGVLDLTIDDALTFFARFPAPAAVRARNCLVVLQEVGLGYLKLGQPINTLSGGESQRLKLAGHLAQARLTETPAPKSRSRTAADAKALPTAPTLFVFDEPTTGLHFEDVRILLLVFQRLVDAGHSVLIVEHNVDVVKSADWLIDLGPEAGVDGGQVVVVGTPEAVANCPQSHTGTALRKALRRDGHATEPRALRRNRP
jgi:excinuclease ABC subunit A